MSPIREYADKLARSEGKKKSSLNAAQAQEILKIIRDDFARALECSDVAMLDMLCRSVAGKSAEKLAAALDDATD